MSSLQKARDAAGLSQSELAKNSGVAVTAIHSYEQGRRDLSRAAVSTVLALARALGTSVEALIEE